MMSIEHKILRGLRQNKHALNGKKITIYSRLPTIFTSSETSYFRVQQWKTDVLGHKGQF